VPAYRIVDEADIELLFAVSIAAETQQPANIRRVGVFPVGSASGSNQSPELLKAFSGVSVQEIGSNAPRRHGHVGVLQRTHEAPGPL
jgi:hypothetical protein